MFAKLVAVIFSIGICACALLAMRQSRLQAASEVAQAQLRISELDERLWMLRARIAEGVTPVQVERMAAGLGRMTPATSVAGWDVPLESNVQPREVGTRSGKPARSALASADQTRRPGH